MPCLEIGSKPQSHRWQHTDLKAWLVRHENPYCEAKLRYVLEEKWMHQALVLLPMYMQLRQHVAYELTGKLYSAAAERFWHHV